MIIFMVKLFMVFSSANLLSLVAVVEGKKKSPSSVESMIAELRGKARDDIFQSTAASGSGAVDSIDAPRPFTERVNAGEPCDVRGCVNPMYMIRNSFSDHPTTGLW